MYKKNDKVYEVHSHFSSVRTDNPYKQHFIATVIERTVESCGKKVITFRDYGYDRVFGRSVYHRGDFTGRMIFSTREEAYKVAHILCTYVLVGEYTDRDHKVFDDIVPFENGMKESLQKNGYEVYEK